MSWETCGRKPRAENHTKTLWDLYWRGDDKACDERFNAVSKAHVSNGETSNSFPSELHGNAWFKAIRQHQAPPFQSTVIKMRLIGQNEATDA